MAQSVRRRSLLLEVSRWTLRFDSIAWHSQQCGFNQWPVLWKYKVFVECQNLIDCAVIVMISARLNCHSNVGTWCASWVCYATQLMVTVRRLLLKFAMAVLLRRFLVSQLQFLEIGTLLLQGISTGICLLLLSSFRALRVLVVVAISFNSCCCRRVSLVANSTLVPVGSRHSADRSLLVVFVTLRDQ